MNTALAIEHLRMTVLSGRAAGAEQAGVLVDELAALLADYDRLAAAQGGLICCGCRIENHRGERELINPAAAVINGVSMCLEHWQLIDGPVMPDRTPGGIVLPGQINGS